MQLSNIVVFGIAVCCSLSFYYHSNYVSCHYQQQNGIDGIVGFSERGGLTKRTNGHDHAAADSMETAATAGRDNFPTCMLAAFHTLCLSGSSHALDPNSSQSCHRNPAGFLRQMHRTNYTPSNEEVKARNLMSGTKTRLLSVGASKSKAGVCNDVAHGKTICTDRPQLDLFEIDSWFSLVNGTTGMADATNHSLPGFEVIFAEHVLEHFGPTQVEKIAAASFAVLSPGGTFRIAVPDGYKPSPSYQKYIRPGTTPSGEGQQHMVTWTVDTLPVIFSKVGYEIDLKEYFSADGKLVSVSGCYEEDSSLGKVKRSFKHDHRNQIKPYKSWKSEFVWSLGSELDANELQKDEPMYTSLWFDAVKPASCDYVLSP